MPQLIFFFSLSHMSFLQKCSRSCSRLHVSVSVVLSPPTSPTSRETGGVDSEEMDEDQFFFFSEVTEGQKEAGGTELRRSNKSDNTKMEMDRETLSWLRVNTHPRSVGVRSAAAGGELIMK